jgi:hypothetical protein
MPLARLDTFLNTISDAMAPETYFDGFKCTICHKFHGVEPVSFCSRTPDTYAGIKQADRQHRAMLGTDQCVIDQEQYFLRGIVEIPIVGLDEVFLWGAWARVWQKDYEEMSDFWDTPEREKTIGPYKGRLNNNIPTYEPETFDLKCTLMIQPIGTRPLFVIEEPEHPLAIDQRHGISMNRVLQIASIAYHAND